MINPKVKSQAKGQNNRFRALIWGIGHHCNLNGSRDITKNKICNFLKFSHFSQFCKIWKTQICIKLVVSLKVYNTSS